MTRYPNLSVVIKGDAIWVPRWLAEDDVHNALAQSLNLLQLPCVPIRKIDLLQEAQDVVSEHNLDDDTYVCNLRHIKHDSPKPAQKNGHVHRVAPVFKLRHTVIDLLLRRRRPVAANNSESTAAVD